MEGITCKTVVSYGEGVDVLCDVLSEGESSDKVTMSVAAQAKGIGSLL